jgi:hypothetical protein
MQPPAGTRLGDVTDALVSACAAIANVVVFDSPNAKTPTLKDTIEVGVTTITGANPKAEGLALYYEETLSIPCLVSSWLGGSDMKARRDRCIDIWDQIRVILAANHTLSGACDQAMIGPSWAAVPLSDQEGVTYKIGFNVQVKANGV